MNVPKMTHFDPQVIGRNQAALFQMEQEVEKCRDNFEITKKKLSEMNALTRRLEVNSGMDREDIQIIRNAAAQIAIEVEVLERELKVMDELLAEAHRVCAD